MALSKTIIKNVYGQNITLENCYLKINELTGNKNLITFNLYIYNSDKTIVIDIKRYSFIPDTSDTSSNFIKQGYEYLKTLDEFTGYIDLLDEGQTA